MALIEPKNVDVSAEFKELAGTVFITHIITMPTMKAALIVDHKTKEMFVYEYREGEISVSLSPIEDDEVREEIELVIVRARKQELTRERGE